jgi:hypothetical protein
MHGSQGIKHPNKKPSITIHLNHSIIKLNMAIKVAVNGMSISLIELARSTSINTNSKRNILESLAQITDGSRVGSPSVPAVEDEDAFGDGFAGFLQRGEQVARDFGASRDLVVGWMDDSLHLVRAAAQHAVLLAVLGGGHDQGRAEILVHLGLGQGGAEASGVGVVVEVVSPGHEDDHWAWEEVWVTFHGGMSFVWLLFVLLRRV